MPINKRDVHYPVFHDKNGSRDASWVTFEQHVRSAGLHAFRVHPYYTYCVVGFGSQRFLQGMKARFFVDLSEDVRRSAGMVTRPGNIPGTGNLMAIFLPEKYDAEVFWHEALHAAMMTLERHGVALREQEALTYLQGYIHNQLQACHDDFLAARKTGGLPDPREVFTGTSADLNEPDYYCCHSVPGARP